MLILRGSSVSIVTRLDGVMIGVLLPTEQYFYFGHGFQTGCRIPPPQPPTHWLPGVILSALRKFRLERPDEEVKFAAEQQAVGIA